ncbi:CHASE3 domain-containing protein [Streptomyces sp. NBC_01186]|uniref:hypothetical protein n=1 Tax=unclassified Streptomyces TaxID=2593676 RepID=UPI002DD86845|nr:MULTISPECIES: hypothetical protein [unclassified Streptomyces]WSB78866.1 CHASE3 domain-containing protein [Streptomyces sp. NBC_01775]WSS12931.1 CHASE3 domain-containing protein [Streptomyces sp. NBC_01186]
MQLARHAVSLAALAAVSSLVLTGCGGGDDGGGKDDKIEGAGSPKGKQKPSDGEQAGAGSGAKDRPGDFRTSDIKLPSDLDLVFDWQKPSDPDKAAALDGAADYMRALMHGTVKQDPKDPVLGEHTVPLQSAQEYASGMVEESSKRGYSLTGQERYYKEQVGEVAKGKLAEVSYCANQAKLFSKKVKTGKVVRNSPSDNSYLLFELVMQKPSTPGGPWKARTVEVTEGAVEKCGG